MDEHFIESNAYSVKHLASCWGRIVAAVAALLLGWGFWPAKFFIERAEMEAANAPSWLGVDHEQYGFRPSDGD